MPTIYITVFIILGILLLLVSIPLFSRGMKTAAYWVIGIGLFFVVFGCSLIIIGPSGPGGETADVVFKSIGGHRLTMIETLTKIY